MILWNIIMLPYVKCAVDLFLWTITAMVINVLLVAGYKVVITS